PETRRSTPARGHRGPGGRRGRVRSQSAAVGRLHRGGRGRGRLPEGNPGGRVPGAPNRQADRLLLQERVGKHEANHKELRCGKRRDFGPETWESKARLRPNVQNEAKVPALVDLGGDGDHSSDGPSSLPQ